MQNKQLIAALDGAASEDSDARTSRYYYLYLPRHLAEAADRQKLDALLLGPRWRRRSSTLPAVPTLSSPTTSFMVKAKRKA